MSMNVLWINCDCNYPSHAIQVNSDFEYEEFNIETCVAEPQSFWYRLWLAWNYLRGKKEAVYVSTILTRESVKTLKNYLEDYLNKLDALDKQMGKR